MGGDLAEMLAQVRQFRDERDWAQFHNLRQLIVTLNLEAGELLELTQWRSDAEIEAIPADPAQREALSDELADVLTCLLLVAGHAGINLEDALRHKMEKNARKYPVHLCRGSREKYDRLARGGEVAPAQPE